MGSQLFSASGIFSNEESKEFNELMPLFQISPTEFKDAYSQVKLLRSGWIMFPFYYFPSKYKNEIISKDYFI